MSNVQCRPFRCAMCVSCLVKVQSPQCLRDSGNLSLAMQCETCLLKYQGTFAAGLRLSITCCARLFAVVQVCISCLSGHLALLCLLFTQPQSLGVFSCDSKAYLRVFSSDLNTHLTASYPAYSNISPHSFAEF